MNTYINLPARIALSRQNFSRHGVISSDHDKLLASELPLCLSQYLALWDEEDDFFIFHVLFLFLRLLRERAGFSPATLSRNDWIDNLAAPLERLKWGSLACSISTIELTEPNGKGHCCYQETPNVEFTRFAIVRRRKLLYSWNGYEIHLLNLVGVVFLHLL